jgi:hypothetical protein
MREVYAAAGMHPVRFHNARGHCYPEVVHAYAPLGVVDAPDVTIDVLSAVWRLQDFSFALRAKREEKATR